jgi:acyl carrier protein
MSSRVRPAPARRSARPKNWFGVALDTLLHGGALEFNRVPRRRSLTDQNPPSQRAERSWESPNATRGAPVTSVSNDQQAMIDQILDVIATEGMIPREKLQDDATIESLGLKSIDLVMILTAIEEKFDVYIPMDGSFQEAKDLKGLVEAISAHILKEKTEK